MSRAARIEMKLKSTLEAKYLEIVNESHKHSVPKDSETHFKVLIVSDQFVGQSQVQRQRMVYSLLADELKSGLHALSLRCLTSEEYEQSKTRLFESPQCSKK